MSNDNRPTIERVAFFVKATRHMMNHDRRHWSVDTDAAMIARHIAMQLLTAQYKAALDDDATDDDDDEYLCPDCEELTDCPYDCEDCTPEPVCPSCYDCQCPDPDDYRTAMIDDELVWGDE